jgi:hypothetical protein
LKGEGLVLLLLVVVIIVVIVPSLLINTTIIAAPVVVLLLDCHDILRVLSDGEQTDRIRSSDGFPSSATYRHPKRRESVDFSSPIVRRERAGRAN